MVIDVSRVLLKYFHSIAYDKTSLMNFIYLRGCDTIVIVILFKWFGMLAKSKDFSIVFDNYVGGILDLAKNDCTLTG